jgi:hypothetical protein
VKFYVKVDAEGFEFSPVGVEVDKAKLEAGFTIVDAIPQEIIDRCPGGKDYVMPESKLEKLEKRIAVLEAAIARGG